MSQATDTAALDVQVPANLTCDAGGPYDSPTGMAVQLEGSFAGGVGPFVHNWTAAPPGEVTFDNAALLNATVSFEGVSPGMHSYVLTLTVSDSTGARASATAIRKR